MHKLKEMRDAFRRHFDRLVIMLHGMSKEDIEKEIGDILSKPCYRPGMALYTYNGDSQRYWKLMRYLDAL